MSKRNSKDSKHNYYSPSKKQKLSITIESGVKTNNNRQSTSKNKQDDIWGDDFPEEDLEKIDHVASQALSQMVNVSNESIDGGEKVSKNITKPSTSAWSVPSFGLKTHVPTPRTSPTIIFPSNSSTNLNNHQKTTSTFKPKTKESRGSILETKQIHDLKINDNQKKTDPSINNITPFSQTSEINFRDFRTKLLNENNMNSTLLSQNSIVLVPDDSELDQIEKLKKEKMKLEANVMTREGEVIFLRRQLTAAQQKSLNDTFELNKLIKEQENNHKTQIKALKKENDNITTQLNLKTLEMNSLKDKTKILQKGSVKFIEPQSANLDLSKRNISINSYKKSPSVKVIYKEAATQMEVVNNTNYESKNSTTLYPLKRIPESIFERSEPELPIIDIHVIEKIGKGNLPILQETDNLRVFENTEAVKPIVTIVDNKELNVQFFLANLNRILYKTMEEINSSESLPIINIITATARELLLNITMSLKKIFDVMTNDDIRDMNDFYLSKYSTIKISNIDNIFSAKKLFDKERAIEARRSIAVIAHIVAFSTYLGEYITGKKRLKINDDCFYKNYIEQFKSYNSWSKKDSDFEFLEMILQFVTIMGLTRNAHQFCGAINAIILTLNNAQQIVGFCSIGLDYIYKIFREIVFSRPLVENIPAVSEMMMTFANCKEFNEKLCFGPDHSVVSSNIDDWFFEIGSDTCIIEIFISQINKLINDPIVLMNTTYAIVSFIEKIRPTNAFPWRRGQLNSCKCCSLLIDFAVKSLNKCMEINVDNLNINFQNLTISTNEISKMCEKEFWFKLKRKQKAIAIKGIEFFCHLMSNEYMYIAKRSVMPLTLCLFIHQVETIFELDYPENFESAKAEINKYIKEPKEREISNVQIEVDIMGKQRKLTKSDEKSEWKSNQETRLKCFMKNIINP